MAETPCLLRGSESTDGQTTRSETRERRAGSCWRRWRPVALAGVWPYLPVVPVRSLTINHGDSKRRDICRAASDGRQKSCAALICGRKQTGMCRAEPAECTLFLADKLVTWSKFNRRVHSRALMLPVLSLDLDRRAGDCSSPG